MNDMDFDSLLEVFCDSSSERLYAEDFMELYRKNINVEEEVIQYVKDFILPGFNAIPFERRKKEVLESLKRIIDNQDVDTLKEGLNDGFGPPWDFEEIEDPFGFLKLVLDTMEANSDFGERA